MFISDHVRSHHGLVWVNHGHKLGYISIPKTASTTVRSFVGGGKYSWMQYDDVGASYHIFVVLREPLSRFISGVYESFKRKDTPAELLNIKRTGDVVDMFTEYISYIKSNGYLEVHTTPQTYFLSRNEETYDVNTFINFENLNQELKHMSSKLNISSKISHLNKTSGKRNVRTLLESDSQFMEMFNDVYSEDISLYNSKFNQ